ncbi:MAG: porin family protein, partial [Candidatus Aminicenantales bacterium]
MKKAVLISVVLLVFAGLVSAPLAAASKVNFGLRAGVSLSNNAWSDDDGTEKILVRPTFGAFAVFNLTPMLAIQPEVNYLVMGEWWNSDSLKIVEAFTYIHIPVLLKVRLMREGKIIPALFVGPAIGFLLSAKEAGDDVKAFFKDTDFGADFGLGAEMAAGNMKVVFDAR